MLALVQPCEPRSSAPRPPTRKPSSSSTSAHRQGPVAQQAVALQTPASSSRRAPQPPRPSDSSKPDAHQITSTPRDEERAAPGPVIQESGAFDVHSYPPQELLRLLASLLSQIAATNDKLDAVSPLTPPSTTPTRTTLATVTATDAPIWRTLTTASRTAISTPASILTFHARNIPTISLEAYLLRILKYCPTTNEVFLSLLVYFDRMSKLSSEATGRTFVIDSYNIHRLVIAGVTVASKFFSDVFYTNSRYAKVGGLPQAELNQLELQFLLLNDFRLVIPRDEMQRYAEQLIVFSNSGAVPTHFPTPNGDHQPPSPPPSSASTSSSASLTPTPSAPFSGSNAQSSLAPNNTPPARPQPQPRSASTSSASSYDSGADTETETEGGWTTDDEPTIRPTHSSRGSDAASLSSADETDAEDGTEDSSRMDIDADGERTPEHAIGQRTPGIEVPNSP